MCFIVRGSLCQLRVREPISTNEEPLNATEQRVIASSRNSSEPWCVGAAVKSSRKGVRAVGDEVENGFAERETADGCERDNRVAGAYREDLVVDFRSEICEHGVWDAVTELVEIVFGYVACNNLTDRQQESSKFLVAPNRRTGALYTSAPAFSSWIIGV